MSSQASESNVLGDNVSPFNQEEFVSDLAGDRHESINYASEDVDAFAQGFSDEAKSVGAMENVPPVDTKLCIVCFVDLLGTSAMMRRISRRNSKTSDAGGASDPALNQVADNIYKTVCEIKDYFQDCVANLKQWNSDTGSMIISDSYVVSVPVKREDDEVEALSNLVEEMSNFQKYCLLACNQATRGGIARGMMVYKEKSPDVIIGEALILAHDLESKIAAYPRVVFNADLEKHLYNLPSRYKKYIGRDKDQMWYISYLHDLSEEDLKKAQQVVNENSAKLEPQKSLHELQKWHWIKTYITQISKGTVICCASGEKEV